MLRRVLVAVVVTAVLAGCGAAPEAAAPTATPEPSCQQQAAPFITEIQPIFQEWTDAATLAGNTPRASLNTEIGKLQEIRRRVQAVEAPACAADVRQNLVASMDTSIEAYLAFLAQKPENEVSGLFSLATQQLDLFSRNLAHLQANETLEAAPKATGATVSNLGRRAEILRPYEQAGIAFAMSSVDGQPRAMGMSEDQVVVIEVIGPEEGIQQVSMTIAMSAFGEQPVDRGTFSMVGLLGATMPDWNEAEAWVKRAVKGAASGPQTITVGNRLVTLEAIGTGQDQVLSLVAKVL